MSGEHFASHAGLPGKQITLTRSLWARDEKRVEDDVKTLMKKRHDREQKRRP